MQLHAPQLALRPAPLIRSPSNVCGRVGVKYLQSQIHHAQNNSQASSNAVEGLSLQPAKSAAAVLAAAALVLTPMTVPAGPALAAGELSGMNGSSTPTPTTFSGLVAASANYQQMVQGQQAGWGARGMTAAWVSQQDSTSAEGPQPSKNPGWPMPSPMPHPPADPPQSPSPGNPQQPSLPLGPPDLLPRQPAPGPGSQQNPKPDLPPIPDVPPQLLPPCKPNSDPPQLLPPCQPPGVAPPIRPVQTDAVMVGVSSTSSSAVPAAAEVSGGASVHGDSQGVGAANAAAAVAAAAPPRLAMQVSEVALVPASPVERATGADAPLGAAFDAVLAPRAAGDVPAAAAPSTLDRPQGVVPSGQLDSSNMSVNLDSKLAGTGKAAVVSSSSSKDGSKAAGSQGSKGTSSAGTGVGTSAGSAGALDAFSDWQPGSITLEQVAKEAGKLSLQLLEVVVRIGVFVIKYTLQAFIWLVKLIAQYISSAN